MEFAWLDIEIAWDLFSFFPSTLFFFEQNIYNWFSHHCSLGADNLFLEFHRLTDGEEFCLRWMIARALPTPDLDDEI